MGINKQGRSKALGMIVGAILFGVLTGTLLYRTGLLAGEAIYIIILLAIFLISLRSPTLALFLFFVTIPINHIGGIIIGRWILRLQYVFGASCVLAILYYLFISEKKETIAKRMATHIDIPLFLLLMVMAISIIQTIYLPNNPTISLNRIYNYPWIKGILKLLLFAVYIVLFYVIQAYLSTKEDIKTWLTRYMAIGCIVAVYGIIAFGIYVGTDYYVSIDGYPAVVDVDNDLPRIKATEQEPSFFGFYLITIIPILLALFIRQWREKKEVCPNIILCGVLSITLLALFLTGSRSTLLALVFSVITLFFLNKEKKGFFHYCRDITGSCKHILSPLYTRAKKGITAVITSKQGITLSLLCLILFGFLVTQHWETITSKATLIIDQGILAQTVGTFSNAYGKFWSTRTRLLMSGYALDAFRQHPWLGVGYENYNFYTGNKVYLGLLDFNITWPEVNNYPLRILTEQGIIGFLAFLFLIGVFFYCLFTARRKTNDFFFKALVEGYIAVFVGVAIMLLFTSNIVKPYIWVSLAFAIASIKIINREKGAIQRKTSI